ncbi:hypothetical protein GCM10023317_53380 [Actinopolymorpha pittospori]
MRRRGLRSCPYASAARARGDHRQLRRDRGSADPHVVALDGEVKNSTHAGQSVKAYPGRYLECHWRAAAYRGLRTTRGAYPVVYNKAETSW